MTKTYSRDGDWIRACIARTPGAWGEFVRRTLPLSLSLVERIFDRHGVLCNQPDRDRILENLYAGFLAAWEVDSVTSTGGRSGSGKYR